ncbi:MULTISPECIES: hypothetical protein [Gordonia]|uniref:hypothetical protein n=1 Tax=Gordonia TaxID=2053 RepID=UPI0030FE4D99
MIDPTPSGRNPVPVEPQTRLEKLAHRMRHVYHTRLRTTTLVLCAVWLGLLAFYGFSSGHYNPPEDKTAPVTQTRQTPVPETTQTEAPTSTEESTPTTTEDTTEPTDTSTTDEPANPRRSAPAETRLSTTPTADRDTDTTTPETSTGR